MSYQLKNLMDRLIQKFGGIIKRINHRTMWESPEGKAYHVNTVFLKRMTAAPVPTKEKNDVQQKQEVTVNGGEPESRQSEPRSEEVTETVAKVEEEGTPIQAPKKKKKDRPKKTKSKVEDAPQQGQETIKEQE